jgi:redox-sensitive bicupin YhaK (pirin superfamily)
MIIVRKSESRGLSHLGWLYSQNSFVFANYFDPKFMSFNPLQVINEGQIVAGTGFGVCGH